MSTETRSTKAGRVYEQLRDQILSGELPAGVALDEVRLAEAHQVSRTPVREALRTLESEGLLVPGGRRQLLVVDVSEGHREEIVTVRVALELAAVDRACRLATPEQLDALRLLTMKQRRCAESGDADGFMRLDEQFHLALAALARMSTLSRMLEQLGAFVRLTRLGVATGRAHMTALVKEHDHLLDLVEQGDAQGLTEALGTHISSREQRA